MREELSVANLMKEFKACADVKQEYFQIANEKVQIFYCDGMADEILLFKTILPEIREQLTNSLAQENTSQKQSEQSDSQKNTTDTEFDQNHASENEKQNIHSNTNNSQRTSNENINSSDEDGVQSKEASVKSEDNNETQAKNNADINSENENETQQSETSSSQQSTGDGEYKNNNNQNNSEEAANDTTNHQNSSTQNNLQIRQESSENNDNHNNADSQNASHTVQVDTENNSFGKGDNNTQNTSDDSLVNSTDNKKEDDNNNNQSTNNSNFQIEDFMVSGLKQIDKLEDAMEQVFRGNCVIALKENGIFLVAQTANQPNRQPEETKLEVMVKGPRDNFVENTITNIALVRKRLPTNSLAVEKLIVGERSKTNVAILYFQDIADEKILQEMKQELQGIETDVIFSGELLMEEVSKKMLAIPRYEYTGRPDFVVQALARGRYAVFVEGSAYAMLTPVSFMFLLKSGEDNEYPVLYSSFQRLLRIAGLLIGLLLPAFWLALTNFHQNQLPIHLLATVVQANTGLPLPSALEMLIMLLFFELFREAGLRLPSVIGGTISVVGGLIIGDAAIRAGITSPAMVVVIALSTIATFTLINQSVVGLVSLLRISFIGVTALFGLFGFFTSVYLALFFVAHIKIFGVPYVNVAADISLKNFLKTFLRLNHAEYKQRPEALKPKDGTRTKSKEDAD